MVGWHHWLSGHGCGWTPAVGDGQGGLACCGSWGHKESDTAEWLNWTEISAEWVKGQGICRHEFLKLIAMLSVFTYVGKEQGNKIAPTSLDCCEAYIY